MNPLNSILMKITLHFLFAFLFLFVFLCPSHGEKDERPNIIVFLVDDYDKPETSPYGGKVLTPNLDRLAKEGMICHNAHVTSTVCTPSRYTFLTGRYASTSHSNTFSLNARKVPRHCLPSMLGWNLTE